jgi:hypothetical protein
MSFQLSPTNRSQIVSTGDRFVVAVAGDFRGGQLHVQFSVDGVFTTQSNDGIYVFETAGLRSYDSDGQDIKLLWIGEAGAVDVVVEDITYDMAAADIFSAINGIIGTEWQYNASQTITAIDGIIGTAWKVNVPVINGSGMPQDAFIPNYYGPITVVVNYDGGSIPLNLLYAGEYGGYPSYNLDGSPLPADPSLEVDYTALYFSSYTNSFYLQWNIGVDNNIWFADSSGTIDIAYALDNPIGWYTTADAFIEYFTVDGQFGVQAEINGQFYVDNNPNGNLYFSEIIEGATSWNQIPLKNGDVGQPIINLGSAQTASLPSAALQTVGYDKGGTNAITQQTAINNVGGWISDVTSSRSIAATDKNTIISCTGTITLTLPQGLDTKFNCRVLRYGTGEVTIAGATGVIISSQNSHKRITAQYDMITITRVANNTYVLSGNLKA